MTNVLNALQNMKFDWSSTCRGEWGHTLENPLVKIILYWNCRRWKNRRVVIAKHVERLQVQTYFKTDQLTKTWDNGGYMIRIQDVQWSKTKEQVYFIVEVARQQKRNIAINTLKARFLQCSLIRRWSCKDSVYLWLTPSPRHSAPVKKPGVRTSLSASHTLLSDQYYPLVYFKLTENYEYYKRWSV